MKYILGVDGGGTKTLALLGDADGNVLGRGSSGPSNYQAVGFETACFALESAIREARSEHPGEISAACFGLAGAGRREDIELFTGWALRRFPNAAVKVVSDAEVLLMSGASPGPALALVCGTGSIVYGRTAGGELVRAGGWGYLFGDEGSAYAIGSRALRAVMQAYDGRGPQTVVSELVLQKLNLATPPELVPHVYRAESPRATVAAVAELVEQAAEQRDRVAIGILEGAAQELAQTLSAIYSRLDSSAVSLAITGKTILRGRHLRQAFQHACEVHGLRFTSVHEVEEPAESALQAARQLSRGGLQTRFP